MMHESRRKFLLAIFKLFDLLIMISFFLLAAFIVSFGIDTISFREFLQMRIKIENFVLFLGFICLWYFIFASFGLYHSRRFSSLKIEIEDLLKATTLVAFTILVSAWAFNIEMVTPIFLLVFWIGILISAIFTRLVLRNLLTWIRLHGRNLRFLLIVGTNKRARQFARKVESRPELGYRILGFIDEQWEGNENLDRFGWKLLTGFQGLRSYIRDNVVDEVVITLPMKSLYREASQVLIECEEQGIIARHLSNFFDLKKPAQSKTEYFEGLPLTTHYTGSLNGWPVAIKRMTDFILALTMLIFLFPLFLLTALLIKIDSKGPALFVQERVGLSKRRFRLYKFRTMVDGADKKQDELEVLNEASGPVFKIKNDPRITVAGKFLRKTSIDELPQLINILKGDMSLVGPRPLPVRDYNGFDQDWHRRRFSVRPGITCLWQVNGRSSLSFDKWMQLDMTYIDKWSIWLDLFILAKTIPTVIKRTGAE